MVCLLDGADAVPILGALASASAGQVSAPFRILRPVVAPTPEGEPFAPPVSLRGPLKVFDSPEQGDLGSLRLGRHFLTETDDARRDEVLLAFADGSAALSLSAAGRGAVVFLNFPIALDGSTVAASPVFPSMLHELMRELRRAGDEGADTPGRPWHMDVVAATGGDAAPLRVTDPAGRPIEATVVSRGRTVRLALPPAAQPGHYAVVQGDTLLDVGVVCPDPKETDTRELDLAALVSDGGPAGAAVTVVGDEGERIRIARSVPLWHYFAAAAAASLAAEMLLLALWRRTPSRPMPAPLEGRAA